MLLLTSTLLAFAAVLSAPVAANAARGISISEHRVIGGESVKLATNTGTKGRRVVVLQRRVGKQWVQARRSKTSSKGAARFTYRPSSKVGTRTQLRIVAPKYKRGGKTYAARTTNIRTVTTVAQAVSLAAPATTTPGTPTEASAAFSPARPGRAGVLERWNGSSWVTLANGFQDQQGRMSFQFVLPAAATSTVRARALSSRGAPAAQSTPREVVTSPPVITPVDPPVDPPTDPPVEPEEPTKSWTTVAQNASLAEVATVVDLADGRVLIAGGREVHEGAAVSRAQIFDPATTTFTPVPDAPTARVVATGVRLNDGRVAIFGGRIRSTTSSPVLNNVDIYDPASNSWTTTTRPDLGVGNSSGEVATLLLDGRVLVVFTGGDIDRTRYVYDPSANTWTDASSSTDPQALTASIAAASVTRLADGRVLLAGGYSRGWLKSAEVFDPATNLWSPVADMPRTRSEHSAILLANGDVLLRGGRWSNDTDGNVTPTSSFVYTPSTNTWRTTGTDRYLLWPRLVALPSGDVLTSGGYAVKPEEKAAVDTLNPATGAVKQLPSIPLVLEELHLVVRPDGTVFAFSPDQGPVLRLS